MLCWGDNDYGQLGNGQTGGSPAPVQVDGLSSGVEAISAGGSHTCALMSAGGVTCWGHNEAGELGNNTATDSSVPVDVVGLPSGVQSIVSGWSFTCALTSAGAVLCWGDNSVSQGAIPAEVTGLSAGVQAVAAGAYHACALKATGTVTCWGKNTEGQLGDNSVDDSTVPVDVVRMASTVQEVAAGYSHSCALTSAGSVDCWGDNSYGQLGVNGTGGTSPIPVNVLGLPSDVQAVVAGSWDNCAVAADGTALCWGSNRSGELGNEAPSKDSPVPVEVGGVPPGLRAVAPGYMHTCGLTFGGTVLCWGDNSVGQLGTPVVGVPSLDPIAVKGL